MNYYDILGVSKTASLEEIKQAYKKLAKEHHPDRGGDNKRFSEINAAYDVLKDLQKRQEYDNSFQQRYNTSSKFSSEFDEFNINFFNDLFEKTFRSYTVHSNKDINALINISLSDVFTDSTIQVNYKTSTGKNESIEVLIPAGIKTGDVIKFKELGDDADSRFPRGNLNIKIQVNEDPNWKRNNNDLWQKQTVNVFDLLLGCVIIITTPEGSNVKLTIPKGSAPASVFSIPKYGIPDRVSKVRGNVYIQLETFVPDIDNTQILNQLSAIQQSIYNKEVK
jgi:curved DNA-binding protein